MKARSLVNVLTQLLVLALALWVPHADAQRIANSRAGLKECGAELVGFSAERLERLHALMQQTVDQKQVSGVVTILARHGKVVDYRAYGSKDMTTGSAMTRDVIFRDYSM